MVRKLDRELYDPDGIILDQNKASAGGQLPTGFNPGSFYPSRQHARALQMTIFGMCDTLGQFGIKVTLIEPGAIKTNFFDSMKIQESQTYYYYP